MTKAHKREKSYSKGRREREIVLGKREEKKEERERK